MKWILLLTGVVLFISFALYYVCDMKKTIKEEQDDFENANHLSERTNE